MNPTIHDWIERVQPDDLARLGVEPQGSPPETVRALAIDVCVDLAQVTACMQLLMDGPHVLYVGAPVAVAAYSPRAQRFRVSYDGELAPDLAALDPPAVGLWLTLVAAEAGGLPAAIPHWAMLKLEPQGPSGLNMGAASMLLRYASDRTSLDPYELKTAHAFWTCASYCLDGR